MPKSKHGPETETDEYQTREVEPRDSKHYFYLFFLIHKFFITPVFKGRYDRNGL